MDHPDAAHLAALLGALGVALALAARTRLVLLGGLAATAIGEVGLVLHSASPAIAAAALAALAVGAGGAVLLARAPQLVAPLVLAAAPFRLPLNFHADSPFVSVASAGQLGRLLPLYAVLGVAALALAWRAARGAEIRALSPWLVVPAAAFFVFAALSFLWTSDQEAARDLLAFFLLPFGVLVAVVARAPFPRWLPRVLAIEAVALGLLFAAVAIWEAATHRLLFFSPSLEVSNTYGAYFRVTSLFRDPSLYGRHVVLAIGVVLVALWLRRISLPWAAALIAPLWLGLYFSYSQSSFVALFAVAVAVTAVAGDRVGRRAVVAVTAACVLAAGGVVAASARDYSARQATSDRSRRVELTARVFEHHPIIGAGLGAQPHESQLISPRPGPENKFVSHTTPLTVAAELGIVGVAIYLALLVGAARLVDLVRRADVAFGLSLGAVLLALLVHSLMYSGFFEDPITWLALALAAGFVAVRARVSTS